MKAANTFSATIEIIGINPFVYLPEEVLQRIFKEAGTNKSPIPVTGIINSTLYRQTLMYYRGAWRLYINTSMLKNSPKRIGETISLTAGFDKEERTIPMHLKLAAALEVNANAKAVFERLTPSLQKEILRYIHHLKSESSIDRNVAKAIRFLLGEERFAGRDTPPPAREK